MGFGDVRSYNPTSPVNTPNIDRIANAGMRFENAHSSSSVCSPTRYSLLTGQYAWRTRLQSGVILPHERSLIDTSRLTVADMLKEVGYSTAAIGKWHLGMNWTTTNGQAPLQNGTNVNYSQPFTGGPLDHGFDTYIGDDIINWPPYTYIRDNQTVGSDFSTPATPIGNPGPYTPPGGNLAGLVSPGYNTIDVLPAITNQAVSYIGARAPQANPFFLYFPMTAPHDPVLPPPFMQGSSGVTGPKQAYGDFIASVDWAVGQVLDALADPNNDGDLADSIVDNTLIVFSADNGMDPSRAFATSRGSIDGVGLRGEKWAIYEGGHRVPLAMQWNGHIPAGATSDQLTELNDFMATVADLVGYDLPANAAEDSASFAPQLLGQSSAPARNRGVAHSTQGAFAISQYDEAGTEWKLVFTSGNGAVGDSGKVNPMSPITDFTKLQLYNLTSDVGEQVNLLSGGGTPQMQERALAMQAVLQGFISSGRSTPLGLLEAEERIIRIDVGINTQRTLTTGWNNLTGDAATRPEVTLNLVDTAGVPTGYSFQTDWTFVAASDAQLSSSAANYDGPYPSALADIPMSALRDSAFVRDGSTLTMTLSNLRADAEYDFLFYGAASNTGDYSLFTVTGSNSGQDSIVPLVNNSMQVANIDGILATAARTITVLFEGRRPNGAVHLPGTNDDALGRFNFMQIIERLMPVTGDYTGDRIVDAADYTAWRESFGSMSDLDADGNGNGVIDAGDYVVWRNAMSGASAAALTDNLDQFASVPEPAAAQLLLMALIVGCGPRCARRRLQ
jgi:arylsulfatase A-like enzyme